MWKEITSEQFIDCTIEATTDKVVFLLLNSWISFFSSSLVLKTFLMLQTENVFSPWLLLDLNRLYICSFNHNLWKVRQKLNQHIRFHRVRHLKEASDPDPQGLAFRIRLFMI